MSVKLPTRSIAQLQKDKHANAHRALAALLLEAIGAASIKQCIKPAMQGSSRRSDSRPEDMDSLTGLGTHGRALADI
ncbi:hypothetical protein WOLCODRAFT_152085 [Wolfiporia cocos MD-104 SS10]|uniref:Uncharacterized protein n=1 Tax=Wolfiporia cocos (strain MD-104) TaxID=742152 RepID=A0A2H3JW24_WOLCO|nr:hypothetical protein WOLCODRAFT_152085 [Wolfiporia cocos MD-104 SS10]